jgi:hypothetical protein
MASQDILPYALLLDAYTMVVCSASSSKGKSGYQKLNEEWDERIQYCCSAGWFWVGSSYERRTLVLI